MPAEPGNSSEVRVAGRHDRPEWLRMLVALHGGDPERDHAREVDAYLRGDAIAQLLPSMVFVVEGSGGGLVGFLELSVRNYAEGCTGSAPYIESWYVDPDHRHAGVGRALMGAAEGWARAHGYSELASDALVDNDVSHRAHEALGFCEG